MYGISIKTNGTPFIWLDKFTILFFINNADVSSILNLAFSDRTRRSCRWKWLCWTQSVFFQAVDFGWPKSWGYIRICVWDARMKIPFQKGARTTTSRSSPHTAQNSIQICYDNSNAARCQLGLSYLWGELLLIILLFVERYWLYTHWKLGGMGVQRT